MTTLITPIRPAGSTTAGTLVALMCTAISGCDVAEDVSMAKGEVVSLRCELAPEGPLGDFRFTVTVKNLAKEAILLLRYNLPEDGVMTKSLFVVEHDGVVVPYQGLAAKRAAPTRADYFELGEGEQVTAAFGIATGYDISSPGQYSIRYRAFNPQPGSQDLGEVVSNIVHFAVEPQSTVRVPGRSGGD